MRAYVEENLAMSIDFQNGTAGQYDWFTPSHIIGSTYTDLPSSDTFHNSSIGRKFIANNGNGRFWYINSVCVSKAGINYIKKFNSFLSFNRPIQIVQLM